MKHLFILMLMLIKGYTGYTQSTPSTRQEAYELLNAFMQAISDKDSVGMYGLFAKVPVTWVGVRRPRTAASRPGSEPAVRVSDFTTWFRNMMKGTVKEERYKAPKIEEDGAVGSITFDYSFWSNAKKGNWGKETWGIIREEGRWKIASVLFSIELEAVSSEYGERSLDQRVVHGTMDTYIRAIIDSTHFQGTVLVAKGDSVIHHKAYGSFDVERNIPNDIHSQYLIGSLTKSFVAVAAMQLAEEGKIDLRAPVSRYLPGLKTELAEGLTLHHLLKQQSGLASSFDNITTYEIMDITPGELLAIINKTKRSFEPGAKYQYTNINYTLMAMVIAAVSGEAYESYLQTHVFDRANMRQTGIERLTNVSANRAVGYRTVNELFRRIHNSVAYAYGAGDIYATAGDIFLWGLALQQGRLVNQASLQALFNGAGKEYGYYGYGFRIQPYARGKGIKEPGKLIRHGGTMNGFISNYHYYAEDDLTVIILANYRDIPIRRISYHLKEMALGLQPGQRANTYEE